MSNKADKRGRYRNQFIAEAVRLVDAGEKVAVVARMMLIPEDLLVWWMWQHRTRGDGEESYWLAWMTRRFAVHFEFGDAGEYIKVYRGCNDRDWYVWHSEKGLWNDGWVKDGTAVNNLPRSLSLVEALKLALRETSPAAAPAPANLFSEVAHG